MHSSRTQMRVWQADQFDVKSLVLRTVSVPLIGEHQVLVRVGAVSLNYRDKLILEGGFGTGFKLPLTPASDAAGTVVEVGSQVRTVSAGDRVIGTFYPQWLQGKTRTQEESENLGVPLTGVLAEYILLDEQGTIRTPSYLSDAQASTLPVAAVTAFSALFDQCRLQSGEIVLVQGTGGVSLFALQLAKAAGARVIVTSSSDSKLKAAMDLGAFAGVNYQREPEWHKTVQTLTAGAGVEHIIEVAGGKNLARSLQALAQGGHIAIVGFLQDASFSLDIVPLMLKMATIHTVGVGSKKAFERLCRAMEASALEPVIDSEYTLGQVPQAFNRLSQGPFGKIVIKLE